jgi:hypothetical protein
VEVFSFPLRITVLGDGATSSRQQVATLARPPGRPPARWMLAKPGGGAVK